jgi:ferredoxin
MAGDSSPNGPHAKASIPLININVINRQGATSAIQAGSGVSLMEAIRENGFDQLLALCGGCCSCATCHVFVEAGDAAGPSEDESDLLESSGHRQANSRLSCQLKLAPGHEGLTVRIAPEE